MILIVMWIQAIKRLLTWGLHHHFHSEGIRPKRVIIGHQYSSASLRIGENFTFVCATPPPRPFFRTMEEAGLNPKTSCVGALDEMVCPGGKEAFITRIIEDSAQLKHAFRVVHFNGWK